MTLGELLGKYKLIQVQTRTGFLLLFIDKIDPPTAQETAEFLNFGTNLCKTLQEMAAFKCLVDFNGGGGALVGFPMLSRPLIAYQLALRVFEPTRIHQGGFGLCGPTAFAVDILRATPLEFVKCAIKLANTGAGKLRGRNITPCTDIRNYQPPISVPQADFMMLASLRSSDDVLDITTETSKYGGTSGAELFDWCVASGYERVLLITCPGEVNFELTDPLATMKSIAKAVLPSVTRSLGMNAYHTHVLRRHPDTDGVFGIEGIDVTNKLQVLKLIPFFLGMGWKIFMQGQARIATAASSFDEYETKNRTMTAEYAQLGLTYAAKDSLSESLKEMGARSAEPHWMLVENLWIYPNNDLVGLLVHSWGKSHLHPGIPMDLFLSNFEGMIACTPLPAPVLSAKRHRSGSTVVGPVLRPATAQRARSKSF